VALPLRPPLTPQLARSRTALPNDEGWAYEPKWDGFRALAFVDGDELVELQSRSGRPLGRYFPELTFPSGRYVLDGEIVIDGENGLQDFDALSNRIHPAASRIERLSVETPARFVAFDLLARDDESLLELPFSARRAALEVFPFAPPVELTPCVGTAAEAERWLRTAEGVIAKQLGAPYQPGRRDGMAKIKRVRTIDAVVIGWRPGKEERTVGSLILGLYDEDGQLQIVGHTSGFTAKQKRELLDLLEPYRTHERGSGEASRWKSDEELVWEGLRPELVCEIAFDHITGRRIRHGAKFLRWREDKDPPECTIDELRS
jgi:ATP-dependent DNA ligase